VVRALIESRPFTLHPQTYAWPSFRLFSGRIIPIYVVVSILLAFLLWGGLHLGPVIALLLAIAMMAVAIGLSFTRYVAFLKRDQNRQLFSRCQVMLLDDRLREEFSDGSFVEFQLFAITEIRALGDFLFIFASKKHAMVVPKTAFASPEEVQVFIATIRDGMVKQPS
jgi:hypothetical protein